MKQILIVLSTVLLLASCSQRNESEFFIQGIRSIDFTSNSGNVMMLSIQPLGRNPAPMELKITGLPAGITATAKPASGIPPFTSTITFNRTGLTAAGSYQFTLVAYCGAGDQYHNRSLTVPATNGWIIDNTSCNLAHTDILADSNHIMMRTDDFGSGEMSLQSGEKLPQADGTYTYRLTNAFPPAAGEMTFRMTTLRDYAGLPPVIYSVIPANKPELTLSNSGGKMSLFMPPTGFDANDTLYRVTIQAHN